jgi:hypothetical protein
MPLRDATDHLPVHDRGIHHNARYDVARMDPNSGRQWFAKARADLANGLQHAQGHISYRD